MLTDGKMESDGEMDGTDETDGTMETDGSLETVGVPDGTLDERVGPSVAEGDMDGDGEGLGLPVGTAEGLVVEEGDSDFKAEGEAVG